MTVIVRDEMGNVAQVIRPCRWPLAEKQPLSDEKLREQLGRLGGTPFELGELKKLVHRRR